MKRRPKRKKAGCPRCAELEKKLERAEALIEKLEKKLSWAMGRIQELEKEIENLKEKLKEKGQLNSQNSSIPPSKDPLDAPPRPPKKQTGRKRGGQKGHPGKRRELVPAEEVDKVVPHVPTRCEHCKAELPAEAQPSDPPPTRHQIVDLLKKVHEIIEHQGHARTCNQCGKVTRAEIPDDVSGSAFGPQLVATIAMLTGGFQVSRRNAEEFVEDVLGVPISLGSVSNVEAEVTDALEDAYQEAAQAVREAPRKNVDETGWKKAGDKCWLWTAATRFVAFFVIHKKRGKEGFLALIGKIKGFFTTDRWHVYGSIKNGFRQVCWCHLKRDFQRLVDIGGERAVIGQLGLEIVAQVFMLWKDFKAGEIDRQTLKQCLRPLKKQMREVLIQGIELQMKKVSIFCENLLALEPALWNFAYHEGLEPTNNHAERVLRRGVLWRHRSFGANSERGCRYVERMLTVVQTCRLQKRRIYDFLVRSIEARRCGTVPPSLVAA